MAAPKGQNVGPQKILRPEGVEDDDLHFFAAGRLEEGERLLLRRALDLAPDAPVISGMIRHGFQRHAHVHLGVDFINPIRP
jgi:hypothetical protein